MDMRKAVFLCVTQVDISTRSIDSTISEDGGDSPPTVAVHRWVVAVRRRGGEEKEVEVWRWKWRRVLRGLWTRSIMHLLAGVVPLSHRRAIAPARRYSSL
jgi:hypothetical protein